MFGRIHSTCSAQQRVILTYFVMQRAQAYLLVILHSLCRDMRPSTLPILPPTSPGASFWWNIHVYIVFCIRELARILELECCTNKRRLEHYNGPCYVSQRLCRHRCWGVSYFRVVRIQALMTLCADIFKPISGMEQWGLPFTFRR